MSAAGATISVRLTDDEVVMLRAQKALHDCTVSQHVRQLINRYDSVLEGPPEDEKRAVYRLLKAAIAAKFDEAGETGGSR